MGTLSALPIISAGNLCCCLWVICGGGVAAYVLQQNQSPPITPGDGALAGLLAGVVGAFCYLLLSIPITILIGPLEREVMQRVLENAGRMRPEFRSYAGTSVSTAVRLIAGFIFMLVVGSSFSTLGGVLGALIFRHSPPAAGSSPA
jgi:hypothetical protein